MRILKLSDFDQTPSIRKHILETKYSSLMYSCFKGSLHVNFVYTEGYCI